MPNISAFIHALKEAGLRITPQRIAICELLIGDDRHPTASAIYGALRPRFPSLSLATVYNTLDRLVSLGLVNVLGDAGDDALHYDADTNPHINLACLSCSRIIDIPSRFVDRLESEVGSASGYKLLGARLVYYGLCPDCQKKAANQPQMAHASTRISPRATPSRGPK